MVLRSTIVDVDFVIRYYDYAEGCFNNIVNKVVTFFNKEVLYGAFTKQHLKNRS